MSVDHGTRPGAELEKPSDRVRHYFELISFLDAESGSLDFAVPCTKTLKQWNITVSLLPTPRELSENTETFTSVARQLDFASVLR